MPDHLRVVDDRRIPAQKTGEIGPKNDVARSQRRCNGRCGQVGAAATEGSRRAVGRSADESRNDRGTPFAEVAAQRRNDRPVGNAANRGRRAELGVGRHESISVMHARVRAPAPKGRRNQVCRQSLARRQDAVGQSRIDQARLQDGGDRRPYRRQQRVQRIEIRINLPSDRLVSRSETGQQRFDL